MAEDEGDTTAEGKYTMTDAATDDDTESSLPSSAELSPCHLPHELPDGAAEEERGPRKDVLARLPDTLCLAPIDDHMQIWDALGE